MDSEIKSELKIIIILHDINSLLIGSEMETEVKKKPSNRNPAHQDTFGTCFLETFTIAGKFCLLLTADGKR